MLWSVKLLPLWNQVPQRKTLKAYRKQIRVSLYKITPPNKSVLPLWKNILPQSEFLYLEKAHEKETKKEEFSEETSQEESNEDDSLKEEPVENDAEDSADESAESVSDEETDGATDTEE